MNKNRVRYTQSDVSNSRFYQTPKFLFEGEFKALSSDAKLLYALLKDKHELSLMNNWRNEKGEIYLIYTRENMAEMLGCSQPTLRKAITQLIDKGLMEEERQGVNKPNLIYLLAVNPMDKGLKETFSPECKNVSVQSERMFQSGVKESFSQECKNLSPNDTNINQTNINDTDISQSINQEMDGLTDLQNIIKNSEIEFLDKDGRALFQTAIEQLYFSEHFKLGEATLPQAIIRDKLSKLDGLVVTEVYDKLRSCGMDIKNPVRYTMVMLLNQITEGAGNNFIWSSAIQKGGS